MQNSNKNNDETIMPNPNPPSKSRVKRVIKDSVFTDLFKTQKNLIRLVQELHPNETVKEQDIELLNIGTIFTYSIQNDLGLLFEDKLIILIESQSTYNPNMSYRFLEYIAANYENYIKKNKLNKYGVKKIELPNPEFYVIMTKNIKNQDYEIKLSDMYKTKQESPMLDLRVKVIENPKKKTILQEYQRFCIVFDEQRQIYGYTEKTILETIRICMQEDVLREYLSQRKQEVFEMIKPYVTQEQVNEEIRIAEREEGRQEGLQEGIEKGIEKGREEGRRNTVFDMAKKMLKENADLSFIEKITGISKDKLMML